MGLYIEGMEMPKEDGAISIYKIGEKFFAQRARADKLCSLIEVPPHGDLIDRDTIPWRNLNHPTAEKWVDELHVRIMPAVIEAEGT